jgi:hypothetical protein
MGLERFFIGSKKLGNLGTMAERLPALLQTTVRTKNIQEQG